MSAATAASTLVTVRDLFDIFLDQLCQARQRVLLMDYDGTIAPFSAQRNRAFPYPGIPKLLDCIMSTCRTRIVLISGRPAREIPRLLGITPHPEIWGSCGTERLQPNGQYDVAAVSDTAVHAIAEAQGQFDKEGLAGLVETKSGAIAVHWRGLNRSRMEEIKAKAYEVLAPLAQRASLLLTDFDGGLELREPMYSKGDVVTSVLREHGADVPMAYLGDDLSDEDAFRTLNGRGLTVLVRATYRFTAAQMWIRPPGELVQFFADWIRACGGDL